MELDLIMPTVTSAKLMKEEVKPVMILESEVYWKYSETNRGQRQLVYVQVSRMNQKT